MKIPKEIKNADGAYTIRIRKKDEFGKLQSYYITDTSVRRVRARALSFKLEDDETAKTLIQSQHMIEDTPRIRIEDYIASKCNVLSPSTVLGYKSIVNTRFQKYMDTQISDIQSWQIVVNEEAAVCSPKTLKNAWALMMAAIDEPEMKKVKLPMIPKSEKEWLTQEQIPLFLSAIRGSSCEAAAILALHGLRRSEVFAIKWEDISGGFIHIHGSVVLGGDGMVEKKTNKTVDSARDVPIMIDRLLELKKGKSGKVYTFNPTYLYSCINDACEKAGLPHVGVHGLRHSFASLGYGHITPMQMMKLGGWSDLNTVQKIYTHISEKQIGEAGEKMKELFSFANK